MVNNKKIIKFYDHEYLEGKALKKTIKKFAGKIKELKLKKYNVNEVKKPWSITSNGKSLSRNTLYIGDVLPDFLLSTYFRISHILSRPNGSTVDTNIKQKVKKTILKELIRIGYKYETRSSPSKDPTKVINNIIVRIKRIKNKGWAVIIDRRKSADVDRDTTKIRKFLENNGIVIEDENICPTYCISKKIKRETK
jgi:hypothetical protein